LLHPSRRPPRSRTRLRCAECKEEGTGDAFPGTRTGRLWAFRDVPDKALSHMILNDEATLIVGTKPDGGDYYLERTSTVPAFCAHRKSGKGPRQVLIVDSEKVDALYPVEDAPDSTSYSWDRVLAPLFDAQSLQGKDIVVLSMLCDVSLYFSKGQTELVLAWTRAGHELLIADSDRCKGTQYPTLPFPFHTVNPGAEGKSGDRLVVVESDILGATDKDDTDHYFDAASFINNGSNQLGDANTVATSDPRWCGHLFGTNALNQNGFMQMYAPYEKGVIVYDGFDHDDGAGNPGYRRIRDLELSLPLPSNLPCTEKVAGAFVIEPDHESSYVKNTAQTLTFATELLANQGWKGHVTVTATAPAGLSASVSPAAFDMAGGTKPLTVTIRLPASANAPRYTISIAGNGPDGAHAEAVITLDAGASLQRQLEQEKHVAIYGIRFDVDSAHLQPRSKTVIDEIAKVMVDNPAWRFQVEGHTDSDGGAAYNEALSQRRAQAVVDDLVNREKVDRGRLVPLGFGLTRPVAPNATEAGKALNRRVELVRL